MPVRFREDFYLKMVTNKKMKTWETADGVKFLKRVDCKPSQAVLDFGCRVGHYTIPAAKVVGNDGVVYAVDKDQAALDELQQKASRLNLKNIRIVNTSGQTEIGLDNGSTDVVLFYDVLHYHKKGDREKLYTEAYRILKQNGLLSVYPKHTLEDNPEKEFIDLTVEKIKQEIQDSDFIFDKKHCGLISHDDSFNQGCVLNFRKTGSLSNV